VPGEHTADLFDDILEGQDDRKSKLYKRILHDLYENKDVVNGEFAISRAEDFVRQQALKEGIIKAASRLQAGGGADEAEDLLNNAIRRRVQLFRPGVRLTDAGIIEQFLSDNVESFPTGIPELDRRGLGPIRKGLHLYIGLPKSGKTWWLVNLGRRAVLEHRLRVCHVTLEMSEPRMVQRYYQSLFAVAKRTTDEVTTSELEKDELGRLIDLSEKNVKPKLALDDPKIAQKLMDKASWAGTRLNRLLVKQFPTGQLKVQELAAYLDMLELQEGFTPDLLIVDYADLMFINPNNYRHELGDLYKRLRGIAVERNIAVATATQSNRSGVGSKVLTEGNVSEDFSKIATADCVLTYNQTEAERACGLARIYVSNGRNDEDKFTVLITQNYAMGQFVLDSVLMLSRYWDVLASHAPQADG